ncbi:hypothetical protein D3C86_2015770 [compost metagenome]
MRMAVRTFRPSISGQKVLLPIGKAVVGMPPAMNPLMLVARIGRRWSGLHSWAKEKNPLIRPEPPGAWDARLTGWASVFLEEALRALQVFLATAAAVQLDGSFE